MIPIDLTGRVAVVTGGTRGIGRSISALLAETGASTAAIYRSDEESAQGSLLERQAFGGLHHNYCCDVSSEDSVAELTSDIHSHFGPKIDFLILNAAVGAGGNIEGISLEDWHRVIDTNLTSAFLLARAFTPSMEAGGSVVAISSGAGHVGLPGLSVYGASKAGLIMFCEALAQDLGPRGIRVNTVSPGRTDTGFGIEAATDDHPYAPSEANALRRVGVPNDVARAVLFFCSDLSGFVTAQWLRVNGGVL